MGDKGKENIESTFVPYIVYEGEQARNERHIKRLVIALIAAVTLIFASNLVWLIAWCQYDYSSQTEEIVISLDGTDGGNANYVGNDGDIINGEGYGYKTEENANTNP